jgi:hypothetical protein
MAGGRGGDGGGVEARLLRLGGGGADYGGGDGSGGRWRNDSHGLGGARTGRGYGWANNNEGYRLVDCALDGWS